VAERTRPSLGISAPHAASLRQQAAVLCLRPPNAANPASEQARNPTHSVDLHVRHKKLQRRVLQVLARRTCVRANINHICRCSQAHHQCTGALGFGPVSAQATHRRGTGRRQLWPQFWRPPRACDGHGILARSSTPGCPQRCSRLRVVRVGGLAARPSFGGPAPAPRSTGSTALLANTEASAAQTTEPTSR
jgi:hypothetical protein